VPRMLEILCGILRVPGFHRARRERNCAGWGTKLRGLGNETARVGERNCAPIGRLEHAAAAHPRALDGWGWRLD